jgi:Protein phosphatase 2C
MGRDLASPRWRVVGASVTGKSHASSGQPCADACAVRVLRTPEGGSLLVAVVADGAGASERAPEGARLTCQAILERAEAWARGSGARSPKSRGSRLHARPKTRRTTPAQRLSMFGRADILLWVDAARRRIAHAARAEAIDSSAFSCTLLVALVDETSAAFFQIGDGAIVYRGENGDYVPAIWPQSGEYANCTWFVTDDDVAERVQSKKAQGVGEVALFTDGLQALALRFASREAHAPFFEPMFARLRREPEETSEGLVDELRAFLDSAPVNQRTEDDKTLVLATRLPAPPMQKANPELEA